MPQQIMVIAGETSGDALAAELVTALHAQVAAEGSMPPVFFGAGGPRMAAAGVELAVDMTAHSVVGLWEVVKHYFTFRRLFYQLLRQAEERQPLAVLCVDFSGFNRRFGGALRARTRRPRAGEWDPRLIQFVSPQVWASRPGRAQSLARDFDLLLSIFPFEKAWYAQHAPGLRVEFVGHPVFDRYPMSGESGRDPNAPPEVLLLPGSRAAELKRHLPPMLQACRLIQAQCPQARAAMVLPDENLRRLAVALGARDGLGVQVGGLAERLRAATVAIASTGTVTVECAYFGVPTVTLYKTSWLTYQVARRMVAVPWLSMPNILAGAPVYPEFVQDAATGERLAQAALACLQQPDQRAAVRAQLREVVAGLGGPGAAARAAEQVRELVGI